jgi:hypothetical protein
MPVVWHNHCGGVGGREAQSGVRRAYRLAPAGVVARDHVALARYWRRPADRQSRGDDVLVRLAVAADVPGIASNAAGWRRLLAEHGGKLSFDRGPILHHGLGARKVRYQSLKWDTPI